MFNFDFLEKGLIKVVSPPHFMYNFSRKMFLISHVILTDQIFCFLGCDVINFELNLIFLIKPFLYLTKNSKRKFNYLETEKSF